MPEAHETKGVNIFIWNGILSQLCYNIAEDFKVLPYNEVIV